MPNQGSSQKSGVQSAGAVRRRTEILSAARLRVPIENFLLFFSISVEKRREFCYNTMYRRQTRSVDTARGMSDQILPSGIGSKDALRMGQGCAVLHQIFAVTPNPLHAHYNETNRQGGTHRWISGLFCSNTEWILC